MTAGDLAVNATRFARHIRAANLSPTIRTYLASLARLADFLQTKGMPITEDQLAS